MTLNGAQIGGIALGSAVIAGALVTTGFLLGSQSGSSGQATAVLRATASASVPTSAPPASKPPASKPQASAPPPKPSPAKPQHPDWSKIRYPINCGGVGVVVVQALNRDFSGDGRPEALRLVRCNAGAGTPGTTLFAYRADSSGTPHLFQTLIRDVVLYELHTEGNQVYGNVSDYSSDNVARCCPDIEYPVAWEWVDSKFVRLATS